MTYASPCSPGIWPNFFLVGAPKCGTTAIAAALEQHPDVYQAPIKEPNFFNPDVWVENVAGRVHFGAIGSRAPLFHAVIRDEEEYLRLYEDAHGFKAIGDYSVNYLRSKEAPVRIFNKSPKSRIVISLRNPMERAYSHFLMECRIGRVSPPFEDVIAKHIVELGSEKSDYDNYVLCSLYFESVKRYIETFGRENVLVVLYDDLVERFDSVIGDVCRHIDISSSMRFRNIRKNDSAVARFQALNRILYRSGIKRGISRMIPRRIKETGKRYYYRFAYEDWRNNPLMPQINEIFADDLIKLSKLIGRDLSYWLVAKTNAAPEPANLLKAEVE